MDLKLAHVISKYSFLIRSWFFNNIMSEWWWSNIKIVQKKAYGSIRVTSASAWSSFAAREPATPPPITTTLFPCLDVDTIPAILAVQAPIKIETMKVLYFRMIFFFLVLGNRIKDIYKENRKIVREEKGFVIDVFSDFRYLCRISLWSFLCAYIIEYFSGGWRTPFQFSFRHGNFGPFSLVYWAENIAIHSYMGR